MARMSSSLGRTRSEYRCSLTELVTLPLSVATGRSIESPAGCDTEGLANLLLDAYRGTIDDEGETLVEARLAVDEYLRRLLADYSVVVTENRVPVALSFVVSVDGLNYVDPVATASHLKGRGLGVSAVSQSLERLRGDGVAEVGAVITDGNTASERLFAKLGFARVGAWQ